MATTINTLITLVKDFGNMAWHLANYEYSAPYAEFDSRDSAAMAARYARLLLEATTKGVIIDPVTNKVREGSADECRYGEIHISPEPCGEIAREIQRSERATSRNCLRVDAIETGIPRCKLIAPKSINPTRWLLSGGEATVFGYCSGRLSKSCPKNHSVNN